MENLSQCRGRSMSVDERMLASASGTIMIGGSSSALRVKILASEDTTGDDKVTVHDRGPKRVRVARVNPHAHGTLGSDDALSAVNHCADDTTIGCCGRSVEVRGTYAVSCLLQMLSRAMLDGNQRLQRRRPVVSCVDALTRATDEAGIERLMSDSKTSTDRHYIYAPASDDNAVNYLSTVLRRRTEWAHVTLVVLPPLHEQTPEFVQSLNDRPGILSLSLQSSSRLMLSEESNKDTPDTLCHRHTRAAKFVVPGGRFNEMYGWDSYFITLGLLKDGRGSLAMDMVDNLVYQIRHYGKILNANRTYYLTRSQPPFLSSMAKAVYEWFCTQSPAAAVGEGDRPSHHRSKQLNKWYVSAMAWAMIEYKNVWMKEPKFVPHTGLSRYHGSGIGVPPETEEGHFEHMWKEVAAECNTDWRQIEKLYSSNDLEHDQSTRIDEYFRHDRAMRESGHDTSYRLEGKAADLNCVDLNFLLLKYEMDFALFVEHHGGMIEGEVAENTRGIPSDWWTPTYWHSAAAKRLQALKQYCWSEEDKVYYDHDLATGEISKYANATSFYPLWAKACTQEEAQGIVASMLPLLEEMGGLVSSTEASRGPLSPTRPKKQWDYPYGWAPHQMMAWQGLANYGFHEEAGRLAYRWLWLVCSCARDFNGTVPEKFDVVRCSHECFDVEYGNVGTDFSYITKEGFGWVNASFQVGLTFLSPLLRDRLRVLAPPPSPPPKTPIT